MFLVIATAATLMSLGTPLQLTRHVSPLLPIYHDEGCGRCWICCRCRRSHSVCRQPWSLCRSLSVQAPAVWCTPHTYQSCDPAQIRINDVVQLHLRPAPLALVTHDFTSLTLPSHRYHQNIQTVCALVFDKLPNYLGSQLCAISTVSLAITQQHTRYKRI